MNFRELPYNQLQKACKLRNLQAKGKTVELIERLEQHELTLINQEIEKSNVDVSADLPIDDTNSVFSISYLDSLSLFDSSATINVPDNTTKEVTVNPVTSVTVTQQVKTTNTTKVVNNPTVATTKDIVTNKITKNVNLTYEQLESFANKGLIILNDNTKYDGITARVYLSKLWVNYPQVQEYLSNYEDHTGMIKVMYGLTKEVSQAKKIITKGRNLTPAKVEYGKEVNRTIYVQNDRGNDLGLPSEKRSQYKSGLKNGIVSYEVATSIYIDDKLIYSASGSVTKLQSQAYTKNGKSKEHKADSGYIGKSKNTKNKRNTGVKLTSSVQVGINTNLMGNLFKLAGHEYRMQVEINHNGVMYLNQYIKTEKIQTVIGTIGDKDTRGNYQVDHATGYKLHDNSVINRHIQRLINKAMHHDTSFMMTSKVNEPDHTYQLNMKQATNNSKRSTRKDKYDNGRYRQAMFNTSY